MTEEDRTFTMPWRGDHASELGGRERVEGRRGARVVAAEPTEPDVDGIGISRADRRGIECEALDRWRREADDNHVSAFDEPVELGSTLIGREVELLEPGTAVPRARGAGNTEGVTARTLHTDHVGAVVGEHHRN